jgi:arylsulfatase A-like enzyme
VPLIIRQPGARPGRNASYVQHMDIAPTVLDALGVPTDTEKIHGKSLLPLVKGETGKIRDFAVCGYYGFSWSILNDEWSYIHWLDDRNPQDPQKLAAMYGWLPLEEDPSVWTCTPGSKTETPRSNELYDRRKDPFQLDNLLVKNADTARALHDQLFELMLKLKMEG